MNFRFTTLWPLEEIIVTIWKGYRHEEYSCEQVKNLKNAPHLQRFINPISMRRALQDDMGGNVMTSTSIETS